MVTLFAKNWWMFAIRGVLAILFGILAFIWPSVTLSALILLFAAYALVDGLVTLFTGFTNPNYRWWVALLEGGIGIGAGLIAFLYPGLTAVAFLYLIAGWAVITGVLEIAAAIRLRREIRGEWYLALSGSASIIFGVLLAIWPGVGLLTTVLLIASYAVVFGLMTLFLALNLRKIKKQMDDGLDPNLKRTASAFATLPLFYGRLRTPIYKPAPMMPTVDDMVEIDKRRVEQQA